MASKGKKSQPKKLPPLFEYQKDALRFLVKKKKSLLRLDTGLGKTRVCIEYAKYLNRKSEHPIKVLVVCPAYLIFNWKREVRRWGGAQPGILWAFKSYTSFSLGGVVRSKVDLIICDEAHELKNWTSKRSKYLCAKLIPSLPRSVFSTATPYVRAADDLYPLYKAIQPNKWGTLSQFRLKYCNSKPNPFAKSSYAKIWYGTKQKNAKELYRGGKAFTFKRRKKDVGIQLPEKTCIDITIDLPEEYHLKNIRMEEVYNLDTGKFEGGLHSVLTLEMVKLGKAKTPYFIEWLKTINRDAYLVTFCWHRETAELLRDNIEEVKEQECRIVHGGLSKKEREKNIVDFMDGAYKYFVGTMPACGTGINLFRASLCAFVELPWNYTQLKQCEDRLHRIGQKNNVTSVRFIGIDTLDNLVVNNLNQKLHGEAITVGEM